ncbi:MAG: hypothetical protein ACK4G1_05655 [Ignavibacteria bacterium]
MFRFLFFLLMMYLLFRALRYFLRLFARMGTLQKKTRRDSPEIIDIDYEEVKDEENSEQSK